MGSFAWCSGNHGLACHRMGEWYACYHVLLLSKFWGYSMVGRVALSGDGASVLWGTVGLDCYAGLWCVSGLGWGIPDQVKNVLIIIFLLEPKI